MVVDICPYVFCPKCKSSNSWGRDKSIDVVSEERGEILWKGWRCQYCGEITLEPTESVKSSIGVVGNEE